MKSLTPSRRTALTIALSSAVVYGYLSSLLSSASSALSNTDEEEASSYFVALRALIRIGSLLHFGSAIASALGALAIWTDSKKLLRLYSLYSLFCLAGELVLFFTVCLTIVLSSGQNTISKLCETFAGHDLSFFGFGWTVESCEDRWESMTFSFFALVATLCVVRAWAAVQILAYYTALVRSRRSAASRSRSATVTTGSALGSATSSAKRKMLLLLPTPVASSSTAPELTRANEPEGVPLLKLTPSSPARSSFPPSEHLQPDMPPSPIEDGDTDDYDTEREDFIVYAPVRMSREQAKAMAAREVAITSPTSSFPKGGSSSKRASSAARSATSTRDAKNDLSSSVEAIKAVAVETVAALEQVVRERADSEASLGSGDVRRHSKSA